MGASIHPPEQSANLSTSHTCWAVVSQTKVIDDLVMRSVAEGTDCVPNLAAGFDTRPYRLDLPGTLCWIEADLPELFDKKESLLSGETPRCALRRERVDLADSSARPKSAAADGVVFFERQGWQASEIKSVMRAAAPAPLVAAPSQLAPSAQPALGRRPLVSARAVRARRGSRASQLTAHMD